MASKLGKKALRFESGVPANGIKAPNTRSKSMATATAGQRCLAVDGRSTNDLYEMFVWLSAMDFSPGSPLR